ncbi:MAG: ferrous iron transporter B, partial [Clostridia bacterium]|nr:ferrous iron transporter B [Clostridia bacterium]
VLFLLVFLSSFYLAFGDYGIGKPISGFLSKLVIENLGFITKNFFEKHGVNTFLTAFTVDGIIGGVGGIFVFLPQILVLVGVLTFLELTGYMSRVAYLSDNLLRKTGLNGRAVFSALMGLGCTAVAVSTTNGLENNNVRKKVVLTSGMISCSAKVPSLMLIASAISSITEFSFMVILYAFGAVLTFLQVALSNKIVKSDKRVPLVMELAPIRLVKIGDFLREIKKALKGFIVKICTVIFIISCFLFLLKSLSIEGKFLQNGYENSILYYIGNLFKFIFYPIGINDWRISSAMISGLFAKEGIATTLISLFPSKLPYKTASIIALSVFFYVYTPCVTAIFSVAESLGKGFSIKFAFLQFFEALFYSYLIYYLISYPIPTVIAVLSILGVSTAVIKYKKHRKTI